jgi:uracil-DNA glycosylase
MPMRLVDALSETVDGWINDLDPAWHPVVHDVTLGFDAVDPALMLEPWEPIFPARRGRVFPGAPRGAHMLRAFEGITPDQVRCVILGQDPYPSADFATGRAFEAGIGRWRELEKMFSHSVRTFMQQLCAARTGRADYALNIAQWPRVIAAIEDGSMPLESPRELMDRWIAQGLLPLNSAFTLSRFAIEIDPHQSRGHLPLWRPLLLRVLRFLAERHRPIVFIGYGAVALDALRGAGIVEMAGSNGPVALIAREHPAAGNQVLALPNPFALCNDLLRERGAEPIRW